MLDNVLQNGHNETEQNGHRESDCRNRFKVFVANWIHSDIVECISYLAVTIVVSWIYAMLALTMYIWALKDPTPASPSILTRAKT